MKIRRFITATLLAASVALAAVAQTDSTFTLPGHHGALSARLQLPAMPRGGKLPVVVLCHGFMGSKEGPLWDNIIRQLNDKGIGAVRFDFNGHGASEGKFVDMTVPNEIADAKAVIEWTKRQPFTSKIALVGHSQGGVVAAMTAGELGYPAIDALVLMAPAAVLRDDALRGNVMGAMFDPWNAPESVNIFGRQLGRAYIEAARTLPIYPTAARYTGPTLIIHGMADRVVPYTYGERFAEVMPHASVVTLPGEDHGFMADLPKATTLASQFLITNLTAGKKKK